MASDVLTTERLEARITSDQKDLFRRAATLRGVTLTDFVVDAVHEAAVKTLEATHVIELGRRDQDVFVAALLNPAKPNRHLREAFRRRGTSKKRAVR